MSDGAATFSRAPAGYCNAPCIGLAGVRVTGDEVLDARIATVAVLSETARRVVFPDPRPGDRR